MVATGLAALALVGGCSSTGMPSGRGPELPSFSHGPSTELDSKRLSLTGIPGDPAKPVITVKVNNIAAGGEQRGIGRADIVAEELVEGGLTRLVAMYQSRVPRLIGPVRSLRSTDVGLVLPTHGPLVNSGGSIWESRYLRKHHVPQLSLGLHRTSGRVPPYNLFLTPHMPRAKGPLPAYFNFGEPKGRSMPASAVTVRFSPSSGPTTFTTSGNTWVKSPDLASRGDRFRPTSVVIIRVTTRVNFIDEHGAKVYESMLVGRGAATLLYKGRAYRGTWSHRSFSAPWRLSTNVPVGRTAFEVVPQMGSVAVKR